MTSKAKEAATQTATRAGPKSFINPMRCDPSISVIIKANAGWPR
jgi:hypothetical protein